MWLKIALSKPNSRFKPVQHVHPTTPSNREISCPRISGSSFSIHSKTPESRTQRTFSRRSCRGWRFTMEDQEIVEKRMWNQRNLWLYRDITQKYKGYVLNFLCCGCFRPPWSDWLSCRSSLKLILGEWASLIILANLTWGLDSDRVPTFRGFSGSNCALLFFRYRLNWPLFVGGFIN